jgi:hypothetical protein
MLATRCCHPGPPHTNPEGTPSRTPRRWP